MSDFGDYAVVYDISGDRERAKVDRVLKGFGFRIQKSVFECRLDRRGRDRLVERLEGLGIQTGFIKIYRLEYQWRAPVIGDRRPEDPDSGAAFIV